MPMGQAIQFVRDTMGARIAYSVIGEGPLILCPAWWVSHVERDWEDPDLRHFFTRLAQGFRVVRYDRPGTGLSDRDVPPRTQACEVELLATLADALAAQQFSVFAVSCAGPVALTYAAAHPDRIRRLCLYGSFARGSDVAKPELRDALAGLVAAHWGIGASALTAIFLPDASTEQFETFSRNQRDWATASRAAELLRLTLSMSAAEVLSRVSAETLIIHRREDRVVPLEAGRRLAAELPKARFMTVDGKVHLPWVGGDEIAGIAHAFLSGKEPLATPSAPTPAKGCWLDEANRELVVEGRREPTTPLEYSVMSALIRARGRVVTRDEMLAQVWRTPYASSNKVEAVVRSLRRKLAAFAPSIETVTGHGYRFSGWKRRT